MLVEQCPQFAACHAPICPLDEHWQTSRHLSGEPVCLYLREASKAGGRQLLATTLPVELCGPILAAYEELTCAGRSCSGAGIIKGRLRKASQSGSKLTSGMRLRAPAR